MLRFFLVFLTSLSISCLIAFPIITLCKKLKMGQTILHYVDNHAGKNGTPTMGGLIFIFSCIVSSCIFISQDVYIPILSLIVMLAFSFLGFLDDFLKIKNRQNEGLKPYQKIVGQVGISLIISLFTYFKIGTDLDFFGFDINIGLFIIPFVIFFIVAVTNSVNLIDGLDGLCGGVSLFYILIFGIILSVLYWAASILGQIFGLRGGYNGFWLMWGPNFFIGLLGIILYLRLKRK